MTDWEPVRTYPTHAEVREMVRKILEMIDSAPDLSPNPGEGVRPEPPDESWVGWSRNP